MATSPQFIGTLRTEALQLIPGYSTRFRPLWVGGANGSQITQISITTNDAAANEVQFGILKKITEQANMGTGALVDGGGGSDTITRSTGNFITDGWRVGERLQVIGATTLANDFDALLTAVASTTLTFATATVDTAENLPSGAYLARLQKLPYVAVPAGAGEPTVVGVSGLDATQMPFLDSSPDRVFTLEADDVLVAAVTTAMGSSEVMDIIATGGDF